MKKYMTPNIQLLDKTSLTRVSVLKHSLDRRGEDLGMCIARAERLEMMVPTLPSSWKFDH